MECQSADWNAIDPLMLHRILRSVMAFHIVKIIGNYLSGFGGSASRHLKYGRDDHELEQNNAKEQCLWKTGIHKETEDERANCSA